MAIPEDLQWSLIYICGFHSKPLLVCFSYKVLFPYQNFKASDSFYTSNENHVHPFCSHGNRPEIKTDNHGLKLASCLCKHTGAWDHRIHIFANWTSVKSFASWTLLLFYIQEKENWVLLFSLLFSSYNYRTQWVRASVEKKFKSVKIPTNNQWQSPPNRDE